MTTEGRETNAVRPIEADSIHSLQNTSSYTKQAPRISARQLSPLRLLVVIIAGIFLAEVVAMVIVYLLAPLPYVQLTLIDAGVMTAMITPLLYFLSFRPLLRYIQKSQRAETDLLRSLALQERFFDSIDTLIAYMDRDFNFIRVNEAYARSDGRQPEDFVGRNHFELYPHPQNQAIFQRVVDRGEAYSVHEKPFEYPEQPERGVTYWNWSLLPVRGTSGVVEEVVLSMIDVTERVRAERKNRQLSRIVEQTADTVMVTDCDGVIEYVNPAFEHMTGYTGEEVREKTPRILKSGIHDRQFYENLWTTILSGRVFQAEISNRKKDGELYYAVKTVTPLRDEHGDIINFVATGKDITEHKRAEEKLRQAYDELELRVQERTEELRIANSELEDEIAVREQAEQVIKESEEKYRSLFNNMSEGFALHEIILDMDGKLCDYRYLELNDAFERLTGISREKAVGKTVKEVLPDVEPYWVDTYGKVALTGKPVHYENYAAPLERWYETYCYSPQRNQFAVVFFDVTERKLAEEALRESRERLERAQEIAHLGSWELDVLNNRLSWSDEVYRIFGLEPQEFGASYEAFLEAVYPDDRAAVDAAYSGSIEERRDSYEIEHRVVKRSSGEVRIVHEKCEHFRDESGRIIRSAGMVHDITERKRAEEALRTARDELELRVQERTKELVGERTRLKNILDTIPDGVYIVNQEYEVEYTNPVIEREFGIVNGRRCFAYFHDLAEPCSWCKNEEVFAGMPFKGEYTYAKNNKSYEIFDAPLVNADGGLSKLKLLHDITQRKKMEQELEQRNQELQVASYAERKQRQAAETLRAATQALTQSLDLDKVLNTLLKHVTALVETDLASIGFVEDETRLVAHVSRDGDKGAKADRAPIFPIDAKTDLFFQRVARSRKSLIVRDATNDPDWINYPGVEPVRSWMGVPILVNEKVIGVVLLGKVERGFFNREHAQSAEALVSQAAVAI